MRRTLPWLVWTWLVAALCLAAKSSVVAQSIGAANNSRLQRTMTEAMASKSGTAVVIDVSSGSVLAAYHPETAARRLALPGSAIKPFTLLALLQADKITPDTALMCKRPLTLAGHNLTCTHPDVKQPFDPVSAVAYSCNSYFANVAKRLTPAELRNSFQQYGFTSPSGLLPNEVSGSVALPATTEDLQLEALGEGGVHVTPLELLRAYQKLAQMQPNHDSKLAPVFDGLEASVSYGMGRLAQPRSPMRVAGKTGTSLAEEGSWRHGWFAGYAPANFPAIALVIFLEKGNGPMDAAGVAQKIFAAYAASLSNGAVH
jgi:penicillin-binding protein 2